MTLHEELHHDFDFKMPRIIADWIDELEIAINKKALHIDCIQDEIRACAHGCTDGEINEEQAEEIITYYCRRRWL